MITELSRPIWVKTPKGQGIAYFIKDNGPEMDDLWGVAMEDTGEFWWVPNPRVRFVKNFSMDRYNTPPKPKEL